MDATTIALAVSVVGLLLLHVVRTPKDWQNAERAKHIEWEKSVEMRLDALKESGASKIELRDAIKDLRDTLTEHRKEYRETANEQQREFRGALTELRNMIHSTPRLT